MWTPILANNPALESRLDQIAEALSNNWQQEQKAGLLTGTAGMAIFFATYNQYRKQPTGNDLVGQAMETAFTRVQNTWHPPTFCSGVPGMLWAADYLERQGALDLELDNGDTDAFLLEQLFDAAEKNDFDFLHGATGILHYFTSRRETIDPPTVDRFVALLEKQVIHEDNGALSLASLVDPENPRLVKNLSLSHGLSSIIIVLSALYQQYGNTTAKTLLEGMARFLQSSYNKPGVVISLFPGYVEKGQPDAVNSRLGWCYGDMGIALALRAAGKALNNTSLTQEGYDILRHAARRKDVKANAIYDAAICHGSAGVAHIFNRVYQETQDPLFREAAIYWLEHALSTRADDPTAPAGYQAYGADKGWLNELHILEGIAGIGLAYMAAASEIAPDWDRCLLIS